MSEVEPAADNPAANGGGKKAGSEEKGDLERGTWTGQLDFLLSCLGYAVGLGNVWRFPYLCFKHGGGAFLIPYTLMLLFIGVPCFFMEISMGQYSAMGPVTVYSNLSPLFKGLGFSNFLASCFVGLYYNMIIAWTIYYLFASFTSELPWDTCENDFNTKFCFNIGDYRNCTDMRANGSIPANSIYHNGTCITEQVGLDAIKNNYKEFYPCNLGNKTNPVDGVWIWDDIKNFTCEAANTGYTLLKDIPKDVRKSASDEYLTKKVLVESTGIDDMGGVQWHLALCLLAAWIIIFLCLIKGIKSSGKVVYFTATYPYFVLIILLIKALTLPGASDGIYFYLVPDWSRLSDVKVWEGAAVQIFFSLSVAGGGLITLASYNEFKNNVFRDTMIVCFGNCLTSFVAGFAIFSVLGFMAKELGVEVKDVAASGTGLAFVAYPDLVTRFPAAPFWSILFFSMLFTLGLDSQFAIVETILTGLQDFKPSLRRHKLPMVGGICFVGFICGLPLCTKGGGYLLDLLDYYAAGWPYLFIGLTELIIIGHVYGLDNFIDDLNSIKKFRMGKWMRTNVSFLYLTLSPAIIFIILILSWANHEPLTKGDYVYPEWANAIGIVIALVAILAVPFVAIFQIGKKIKEDDARTPAKIWKCVKDLSHHTEQWRQNALANGGADVDNITENGNINSYDNKAMVMEVAPPSS